MWRGGAKSLVPRYTYPRQESTPPFFKKNKHFNISMVLPMTAKLSACHISGDSRWVRPVSLRSHLDLPRLILSRASGRTLRQALSCKSLTKVVDVLFARTHFSRMMEGEQSSVRLAVSLFIFCIKQMVVLGTKPQSSLHNIS